MATEQEMDYKAMAKKLHRQFAHPTAEKLISFIRNSSFRNKKLENEIKNVSENCFSCLKYKKPNSRPIVCMPMATYFNEMIAMDLKMWSKQYFLVIVDLATRFCSGCVINNKLPATIIKGFFLSWIVIFGSPERILSDNGGEFNNNEMRALGEAFNITIKTTAAESPWSNGAVERLNGVLGNLVSKILDDTKCDVQTALAWVIATRNTFHNKSVFLQIN